MACSYRETEPWPVLPQLPIQRFIQTGTIRNSPGGFKVPALEQLEESATGFVKKSLTALSPIDTLRRTLRMKIYRLREDVNKYQSLYVDESKWKGDILDVLTFDCKPKASSWSAPSVFILHPKLKR